MKPYFKDKLTGLVCDESNTGNMYFSGVREIMHFSIVIEVILFICLQGPPSNPETKERLSHGTRPIDELKIRRCMF